MATKYELEIELHVSREKVAELFGNPENLRHWQPGFQSYEPIDGHEGEEGSRSRLTYDNGGRKVEMIETIEGANLPEEFTATYVAAGMEMRVANRFEELGTDRTRWITNNEALTSGVLMRVFTFLMPGCFKKQSYDYMKNFKAFAEEGKSVAEWED